MTHVLVVEERRRARERLSSILSDSGYAVAAAPDGRTALQLIRRRRPDVIVHGHVTPPASELLVARKSEPELSSIALVMTFTHPDLALAADVCLTEHFTLDDLLAALARCEERVRVGARRALAREALSGMGASPR